MMTKKNSPPLASRLIHLPPSAPHLLRHKKLGNQHIADREQMEQMFLKITYYYIFSVILHHICV
ncbi:MAG: hypothetical protein J6E29_07325 [Prevotella sp.]|nr:hypothetical protein [Prevotella sp.]